MAKISDFVNVIKCMNGTLLHCKYNVKSDSAILSIYSDEFDDYFDLVNIKICDEDIYCIPCVSIFGKSLVVHRCLYPFETLLLICSFVSLIQISFLN